MAGLGNNHASRAARPLRGDHAPQRAAQAAMLAVRDRIGSDPRVQAVTEAMTRFGNGAALEECDALYRTMEIGAEALGLAWMFVGETLEEMRAHPLGHPAMRHYADDRFAQIVLARSGLATLSLIAFEPGARSLTAGLATLSLIAFEPGARSLTAFVLGNGERYDRALAGQGTARLISTTSQRDGRLQWIEETLVLRPGSYVALDCATQAMLVSKCDRRIVMLRLQRADAAPPPTREYDLNHGALIHQAAGSLSDSRAEMMLRLAGAMGETRTLPAMEKLALGDGTQALRWQALREALAMVSARGFALLSTLAARSHDDLAVPAGALRARLLEQYPELKRQEACAQCPV